MRLPLTTEFNFSEGGGGGVSSKIPADLKGGFKVDFKGQSCCMLASSPGPTFLSFARVGPGSRNFNGTHNSGYLHGDAFFHHDIIPECPWPSRVAWWKYSSGDTDGRIAS